MMKRFAGWVLTGAAAVSLTACGSQTNSTTAFVPTQDITWTCTSSIGGGSDLFTREVSRILTEENLVNGQTIMVFNETDDAGEAGRSKVADTTEDADYQLLTFNSGDLMAMVTNTDYRSSDFRILAILAVDRQLLFSCPAVRQNTAYGNSGGDDTDFSAVIEAARDGAEIVIGGSKGDDIATYHALLDELDLSEQTIRYVSYDSTLDAIHAAEAGELDFVISKPAAAKQFVDDGTLLPILALSGERFSGNLADAPTLSELGDYENVEMPIWRGVAAPKAMDDEAAAYWSDALNQVAESDDWQNYLRLNQLVDDHLSHDDAAAFVSDYEADYLEINGLS